MGVAIVPKKNFRRHGVEAWKPPSIAVHDRRTSDLVRGAEVASIVVDDPYGQPGEKIETTRSTRDDPLANLHARKQIDEAQYQGGRAFQTDWETAERGPRAIDPTKEAVDGGRMPEPITEGQRKAAMRLLAAQKDLGVDGTIIIHEVLILGMTMEQMGQCRGLRTERWYKYFGRRFRECLDRLAVIYGFATPEHQRRLGKTL